MASIGTKNRLTILRSAPPGFYLDGGALGEILLPGVYIPAGAQPGEVIEVFVYRDSEDRLVATTETPHACVGEFANLRVVQVRPGLGAFLDWGLPKDLLLPLRELSGPVNPGERVLVYVMLDPRSDRIAASARIARHLDLTPPGYAEGQQVQLLVAGTTPLGYNAIINNAHRGLLYHSDINIRLQIGQKLTGYIRAVRPDGKIDLGLDPVGYERMGECADRVFKALEAAGGRLPFHDGSTPEEIRAAFGMSKKAFKQAIGALFKERRIVITQHGIRIA